MQKISTKSAAGLLKQAGAAIRTLTSKNQELQEKLAAKDKEERVVKIARTMEENGLNGETTFEEKVAMLREAPNLDVTEEAVKLAAPQAAGFDLGEQPGSSVHPFETWLATGEDVTE